MRDELPRGVRLRLRKEQEACAADAHEQILEPRGIRVAIFEPRAYETLVLLGLHEVGAEDLGQFGVADRIGSPAQLLQRLLLDRMGVRQVLGQLFTRALRPCLSLQRFRCCS